MKVIRFVAALSVIVVSGVTGAGVRAASPPKQSKLDAVLQERASRGTGHSRIIIQLAARAPRGAAKSMLQQLGGTPGRALAIINGHATSLPNAALAALAASPLVERVSTDRLVAGTMERTHASIAATSAGESLAFDGSGIGVAIIDSGVTAWHDDLTGAPESAQRVDRFVDLVGGRESAYDDYGHGTHVAGIVAGNGHDSGGARAGIAPRARLTILKALDRSGQGRVSDVIAALDYIVANKDALNIRVANLSIMAPAYESYETDPLTLAAKRAVEAGIVVVAAAGNAGRSPDGRTVYGAVGAPGNAPWVLTVGASSHNGTADPSDDSIAAFSSRGPAAGGYAAKPDLVAHGVGIESLSAPESAFYTSRATSLLNGTVSTPYVPYLSLSGTSMSAPIVSGTVALMLQANPALTPNQVKAILQYTAQVHPGYDTLTQGAGFLNAGGAVKLAEYFADPAGGTFPSDARWGRRLIWGNGLVEGGRLSATANAWRASVTWGAATTFDGQSIEWGVAPLAGSDIEGTERPWSASDLSENVVWGMLCDGGDCDAAWSGQTVVGTSGGDETVVWGMDNGFDDTVVWGMNCVDSSCQPVIWSR